MMRSLFPLLVLQMWNVTVGGDATAQDCGSVVNNTLKSPNYPEGYPDNMECEFKVPVPSGFRLKITFEYMRLPDLRNHYKCVDDYLTFRDDRKQSFGRYCGSTNGETILMTRNYTLINFHSGSSSNMKRIGFVLRFEAVDQPVQPSICPIGWYHQHGSSCYKFSFESLTWHQASRHCQSLGGYLVKIDDDKEQSSITNKIKEMRLAQAFWIGLHDPDKDNNFKWVNDDTPPRYSNWNRNEPSNKASDCAFAYGIWYDLNDAPFPAGKWNDVPCSIKAFSICEKNADCGSVVNNTLKSPNYPEGYPHKMECNYSVPIPAGTRMKIKFQYFKMPDPYPVGNEVQCLDDHLTFRNEQHQYFGSYCGKATGETIFVTGNSVVIKFESRDNFTSRDWGFSLYFEAADLPVQPRTCPSGWYYQYGSSCYKFSSEMVSWYEAVRRCKSLGGFLVKIDDADEQSFLTDRINISRKIKALWIGLHDLDDENDFKWEHDNTPANFSHWNKGEPDNSGDGEDCVAVSGIFLYMYSQLYPPGRWNDMDCDKSAPYICEKNIKPATVAAPDIIAKTPTLAIKTQKNEAMSSVALIYSLAGATFVVILVLCCIMGLRCYKSKRHARLKRHVQRPFREIIPLDKWEILPKQVHYEEELGRGAFGVVYKATLTRRAGIEVFETRERLKPEKQCQVVAVKVLQGDPSDEQREAFLHEILQMKLLGSHQNIVSLVGCCTLQDTKFLVIEYVPYGDLLQWLRQKRRSVNKNQALRGTEAEKFYEDRDTPIDELKRCEPSRKSCDSAVNQENIELMSMPSSPGYYNHAAVISLSTVNLHESNLDGVNDNDDVGVDGFSAQQLFSFAWQVARGMIHLAENDFVHRDLAARNILVGQDGRVKVSDFGLMGQVYEDVYSIKKTKKLPVKWMAPESIFEGVFTIKSDVWSYGIFLWEMATMGGVPYPTFTNTELCKLLKNGYRMEKPDMCCHEVYEMMTLCWENDPTTRPSFSELIDRLEAIMTRDVTYCDLSNCDESSPYYNIQDMVDEESG